MKVNRRAIIFIFVIAFLGELFLKGSHVLFLTTTELVLIAFLILAERERSYFLIFTFLLTSAFSEVVAWQYLGITAVAALSAYILVKLLTRFIAVVAEQRFLKLALILCLAIIIKLMINLWLLGYAAELNVLGLLFNLGVFLICYLILNRVNTNRNVFES